MDQICRFVEERRQEDLHLEFKTATVSGSLTRDDRKNLGRALSGFANADGGVIIWGIVAKKDPDSVDSAVELRPFENANRTKSDFESLTGQAVNPCLDGVEHKALIQTGQAGFVATYVPASDSGPHMAKLGEDRYYKRAGDSFYKMEHYDIEDMFGRRAKPSLCCIVELLPFQAYLNPDYVERPSGWRPRDLLYRGRAIVRIRNDGRGMARFLYVAMKVEEPCKFDELGLDGHGRTGLPELGVMGSGHLGGGSEVLHINSTLAITAIRVERVSASPDFNSDLDVHYRFCADGMQPREGVATVTAAELAEHTRGVELPEGFCPEP